MSITLDPTLETAQNAQSRRPIVEIISSEFSPDIPFDGSFLTSESTNETNPSLIQHSSDRMIGAYVYGTGTIKFVYTDTDRTVFNFVSIPITPGETLLDVAVCELADGNVGIIYRSSWTSNQYLKYFIVSATGTSVSSGTIATYAGTPTISGPTVIKLSDDSYLLVYVRLDGANYRFYKRTSADFETWSAASEITVAGITNTNRIGSPFMIQVSDGQILLFFDHASTIPGAAEIANVWVSISTDSGATFGAASQITEYDTVAAIALHPAAAQKVADTIFLAYTLSRGAVSITTSDGSFCGNPAAGAADLCFNPATRKLYVTWNAFAGVTQPLRCVTEIDLDSWEITDCWGSATSPAFSPAFFSETVIREKNHGESYLIPVGIADSHGVVAVLDAVDDTITQYVFNEWAAYSLYSNVDHSLGTANILTGTWIDETSKRLYLFFTGGWPTLKCSVGYISLDDPGPIYSYHSIISDQTMLAFGHNYQNNFGVFPSIDFLALWQPSYPGETNVLNVYSLSAGSLYKSYSRGTPSNFPYYGIKECVIVGSKIYGTFDYTSGFGQEDYRGLCEIDMSTDTVTYHRPSWASIDDYLLHRITAMSDGRLLITTSGYGVTIYDPASDTWKLFSEADLPGMDPLGEDKYTTAVHDPVTGLIYSGQPATAGHPSGGSAVMFSLDGQLLQTYYLTGSYSGSWSWGEADNLVIGFSDYDAAITYGPETEGLYAFWISRLLSEYSIKWDKEGTELDLSPFLAKGREISVRRSIDGSPASLGFTVSDGHLFDPSNTSSLYALMLSKGRRLSLRFGENVDGTEYWQAQGYFIVENAKLSYKRGSYPEMSIEAKDKSSIWGQIRILATDHYEDPAEDILSDILETNLGVDSGDIDLPEFDPPVELTHQWIDLNAKEILDQICNRCGYFLRIAVNDKVSAKKISDSNPVDHIYADLSQIIDYTPDDSFSDFTNQVIVIGEEKGFIETLFEEERVGAVHGTVGWWKRKKTYTVYYSTDQKRRCRYPRLEVLESTTTAPFEIGGKMSESITYEDFNETYVEITIEGPDMTLHIVGALAAIYGAYHVGDYVLSVGSTTIPVGKLVQMIAIYLALGVLASVVNFQIEVWACPIGEVKKTCQGEWNDYEMQNKIQTVVPKTINDPLCYSVSDCIAVAGQEGLVTRLQRSRHSFTKTAHLQDEEGDTIQIPHPFSGMPTNIFITDITRKMIIPEEDGEGYFTDQIEGWKL